MGKNVIDVNGGIMINVYKSVKNTMYVKNISCQLVATCSCQNVKYLASIMDD